MFGISIVFDSKIQDSKSIDAMPHQFQQHMLRNNSIALQTHLKNINEHVIRRVVAENTYITGRRGAPEQSAPQEGVMP